jgi:hypothetical protein
MIHIKTVASKHGHQVDISHVRWRTRDNLNVLELTAMCGTTVEVSRVTIGAVDGPRPTPPTHEELQTVLDTHRQRVADEASWKETVTQHFEGVE